MKQQISECMVGELDADNARRLLLRIAESEALRREWTVYHAVSDGMRGSPDISTGFLERVSTRLADEPTVLAPPPAAPARPSPGAYAMYAAASFAAVAVVGWVAFGNVDQQPAPQIARQEAPVSQKVDAASPKPAMSPLKAEDHDYLLAHQAVSPSGGMQGVAPYARTVSFGDGNDGNNGR